MDEFDEPPVAHVWEVLRDFAASALPEPIRTGLTRYSQSLAPQDRTSLFGHALEPFAEHCPHGDFLEAARLHESDLAQSAALVVDAFAKASNEDHRRSIIRLWDEMRLTDSAMTQLLVDGVLLPLIEGAKGSREIALQNLHLVQSLSNPSRRKLAAAFQSHTDENDWSGVEKRLVDQGLMTEKGLSRKTREHLEDK